MSDWRRLYSCFKCQNYICRHDNIVSKRFKTMRGRAFLFSHAGNVVQGLQEDRQLISGLHTVAYVHCIECGEVLGFKYIKSYEERQKYKEGKFFIPMFMIVKANCCNSMGSNGTTEYQDLLPVMAEKLDVECFVSELCGGFRLLADPESGLITWDSLKKNSALLGMEGMSKDDADGMVREGDLDGDGALNETEFCILMVRLSPGMMEDAETWLEKALDLEVKKS